MNEPKPSENRMTNAELADEIERAMELRRGNFVELAPRCVEDIIAALRQSSNSKPAFALMEYLLTQGPKFDIPDSIWIPFVDSLTEAEGHHE